MAAFSKASYLQIMLYEFAARLFTNTQLQDKKLKIAYYLHIHI